MSAIALYLHEKGVKVSGYDRTSTDLTDALIAQGIDIHFEDNVDLVPRSAELVVYTPAIPANHKELLFFRQNSYQVLKRAEVLQQITKDKFTIAVAGSHGKTTVTALIAHLLKDSGHHCTAFIGGITVNYSSNFIGDSDETFVVEADEFDKSFLKLDPDVAIVTAIDTDHLDVYGTLEEIRNNFKQFCDNVRPGGLIVLKHGLDLEGEPPSATTTTYALETSSANCYATNIELAAHSSRFDWCSTDETISSLELSYPGRHNIENAVAAVQVARWLGIKETPIRKALKEFRGLKRRFEYIIKQDNLVFIDDYAHHPREITALIESVRSIYPDRKITAVFQPHLFSRTRDLAREFAQSLDAADEVFLLDIYPAREEPIPNVSSRVILDQMNLPRRKVVEQADLLHDLEHHQPDVLLTIGAGDIDRLVQPIKTLLTDE